MKRIKTYLRIITRVLLFYTKQHPYAATWIAIWAVCCLWKFVSTLSIFWIIWFGVMVLIIYIPYKIYVFLDEFATPSAKIRRMQRKEKTRKQLKEYLIQNVL